MPCDSKMQAVQGSASRGVRAGGQHEPSRKWLGKREWQDVRRACTLSANGNLYAAELHVVSNCFSDGKERILHQWNPMVKSVRVLPRGGHVDAPRARQGDPSQQRKSRTRGSEGVLRGCWSSCEPKERMKALQLLRHRREACHKRARAGRSPACARPLR